MKKKKEKKKKEIEISSEKLREIIIDTLNNFKSLDDKSKEWIIDTLWWDIQNICDDSDGMTFKRFSEQLSIKSDKVDPDTMVILDENTDPDFWKIIVDNFSEYDEGDDTDTCGRCECDGGDDTDDE